MSSQNKDLGGSDHPPAAQTVNLDLERILSIAKWGIGQYAKGVLNWPDLAIEQLGEDARPVVDAAIVKANEMIHEAIWDMSLQHRDGDTEYHKVIAVIKACASCGIRGVEEAFLRTHTILESQGVSISSEQIRGAWTKYGRSQTGNHGDDAIIDAIDDMRNIIRHRIKAIDERLYAIHHNL